MLSRSLLLLFASVLVLLAYTIAVAEGNGPDGVPVLVYHRIGPVAADNMTVTTSVFESHLRFLKDNGFTVIPLRQFIDYRLGKALSLPPCPVVLTADDGHRSVYSEMLPLIKRYQVPVTLFIYPSAISNASYAMTWEQLRELKKTGLFDIQSHTYWHPNFKRDKKRLSPDEYEKSVKMQMTKSREKLEKEFAIKIDMLAWPFGIYDDELIKKAEEAGYVAAFTLDRRHAGPSDNILALPRYLMVNEIRGKRFEQLLAGTDIQRKIRYKWKGKK